MIYIDEMMEDLSSKVTRRAEGWTTVTFYDPYMRGFVVHDWAYARSFPRRKPGELIKWLEINGGLK